MNWDSFNTYNQSYANAFESFCTQLFERFLNREHTSKLVNYLAINGSGGDGGVEACGELTDGSIIGLQAKWFPVTLSGSQTSQIKKSIITAKTVRPALKEYIICIPKLISATKMAKGARVTEKDEEKRLQKLTGEIKVLYPSLKLTWWFEDQLLKQLQFPENEGIRGYWFEKQAISKVDLQARFELQKTNSWLKSRYAADLNGQGKIAETYSQCGLGKDFKTVLTGHLEKIDTRISRCNELISQFLATDEIEPALVIDLKNIRQNLNAYRNEALKFQKNIITNNLIYHYRSIIEYSLWETHLELDRYQPTNVQKPITRNLSKKLEELHQMSLDKYLLALNEDYHKTVFMIYGGPGTGKTQGLAHSVHTHLQVGMPAIIIPALGTPNRDWTMILSTALELPGWTKGQVFAALEAMAVTAGHTKVQGKKRTAGAMMTTTLICVDGLEEDWVNKQGWYDRIAECREISHRYPRIRFMFSAREYFHDHYKVSEKDCFEVIRLPRQGDISIGRAAAIYFKPEHFNIQLDDSSLLHRLDNLYTLKLFCERYRNQHIQVDQKVSTLQRDLLKDKITSLNSEYLRSLERRSPQNQQPASQAMSIISKTFYEHAQLEHEELIELLLAGGLKGYSYDELSLLLDYLTDNGVLVRAIMETDELIPREVYFYYIAYQSIIEHVLSEETVHAIVSEKLDHIPAVFFSGMVRSLSEDLPNGHPFMLPNEMIVQAIFNRVFNDTGKLVGIGGYLSQRISARDILRHQLIVLAQAPIGRALACKDHVDNLFSASKIERYAVFNELILPSSEKAGAAFGAEYFHQVMSNQPTVFARDRFLWEEKNGRKFQLENDLITIEIAIATFIDPMSIDHFHLPVNAAYDQLPLIFSWCLTALDQDFRNNIRKALSKWAFHNCEAYIQLLNKVFFCNDPQIQEDLAAITQGLSNTLKQNAQIKLLAEWALQNLFTDRSLYYSVITRTGFRAIVEKAYSKKLISLAQVQLSRAGRDSDFKFLELDQSALANGKEQIYPIVSDLAWYVIKDVYSGFFEHNYDSAKERNGAEAPSPDLYFLKQYATKYALDKLGLHQWTMAAAIAYIKTALGLTRSSGNGHTSATHGSKSDVFTYEEKYTWLAVTYLQGYLAGQLPYKTGYVTPQFLDAYDLLTVLPDTLEQNPHTNDARSLAYLRLPKWIIPENLTATISQEGDIQINIEKYINSEPHVDFGKWLTFNTAAANPDNPGKDWLAIYQNTMLYDKTQTVYSRLNANALLIKKRLFSELQQIIISSPDSVHDVKHFNGLHASTDTDTYSNPADIVWMNWIGESNEESYFDFLGQEYDLKKTVLQVISNNQDGEQYHYLPVKAIRKGLKVTQLQNRFLVSGKNNISGILFNAKTFKEPDEQTVTYVERNALERYLSSKGWQLFWFVEVFRRTSVACEQDKDFHLMKTRKYLVWEVDGKFESIKFWDERFSNTRN